MPVLSAAACIKDDEELVLLQLGLPLEDLRGFRCHQVFNYTLNCT